MGVLSDSLQSIMLTEDETERLTAVASLATQIAALEEAGGASDDTQTLETQRDAAIARALKAEEKARDYQQKYVQAFFNDKPADDDDDGKDEPEIKTIDQLFKPIGGK